MISLLSFARFSGSSCGSFGIPLKQLWRNYSEKIFGQSDSSDGLKTGNRIFDAFQASFTGITLDVLPDRRFLVTISRLCKILHFLQFKALLYTKKQVY